MKIALFINMPSPYRNPSFNELYRVLKKNNVELKCFFDVHREGNRQWDSGLDTLIPPYEFIPGVSFSMRRRRKTIGSSDKRTVHIRSTLISLLNYSPDIIISCEFGARTLQSLAYKWLFQKKLIIWSEGTLHTEKEIPFFKEYIRKLIVRNAQRFWSNGVCSEALLVEYGADHRTIDNGMTGVDTSYFFSESDKQLRLRNEFRDNVGIRGLCFCFVGEYSARKGIPEYLQAIKLVHERIKNLKIECTFLFVGQGEFKEDIVLLDFPNISVIDLGHVDNKEIPNVLTASDVFVLPTLEDNWPLSSLEAAICGLPQIASIYNGGSGDLVKSESDGLVIDPLDIEEFSLAILSFTDSPLPRLTAKRRSELRENYSPDSFAFRATESIFKIIKGASL